MRWTIPGAVLAFALASSTRADACSFAGHEPHLLDDAEKALDTTPPSAIGETTYSVTRGRGPQRSGCSETSSSCDDIGGIQLYVSEVTDDRTSLEKLGYRVEVVAGSLPGFSPPATAVRAFNGNQLFFHWIDDAEEEQESIDVTFRIRAVDLAGNEGPPRDVRVRDDGRSEGCRVATGSIDLSIPLFAALGAVAWALSRRRARPKHAVGGAGSSSRGGRALRDPVRRV